MYAKYNKLSQGITENSNKYTQAKYSVGVFSDDVGKYIQKHPNLVDIIDSNYADKKKGDIRQWYYDNKQKSHMYHNYDKLSTVGICSLALNRDKYFHLYQYASQSYDKRTSMKIYVLGDEDKKLIGLITKHKCVILPFIPHNETLTITSPTNKYGRHDLPYWGPNFHATQVITTIITIDGVRTLHALFVVDDGIYKLPCEPVKYNQTEIDYLNIYNGEHKTELYRGLIPSVRNTDNAWIETIVSYTMIKYSQPEFENVKKNAKIKCDKDLKFIQIASLSHVSKNLFQKTNKWTLTANDKIQDIDKQPIKKLVKHLNAKKQHEGGKKYKIVDINDTKK